MKEIRLRIDDELHEHLVEAARNDGQPITAHVKSVLRAYEDAYPKLHTDAKRSVRKVTDQLKFALSQHKEAR